MTDILLHHLEFLANSFEVLHGSEELFPQTGIRHHNVVCFQPNFFHSLDVSVHDFLLALPLLLEFLDLLDLLNLLLILLLFLLDCRNALIELRQQVSQFRVDLVYQVGEVCERFVIDAFEEHHRREVLFEILHFVLLHFLLKDC